MAERTSELRLYAALELRAEYDARIKTIKECLPETRQNRERGWLSRAEDSIQRPSPGFDLPAVRVALKTLEFKRRKLNTAIQEANVASRIEVSGDPMTLAEALEVRKGLNERIGELHTQLVSSAYQRVIYKEGRDIVEGSPASYGEIETELDAARIAFRELNRRLREASYQVAVKFQDEN